MTKILIVDDYPEIRELMAEILRGEGFCVGTAANAEDARPILAAGGIALAFVDVIMPGEPGLSLARDAVSLGIPVVLMSGNAAAVARLAEEGERVLAKPFRVETVLRAAREALSTLS